jgi:NAD-dependent DNA ligase
VLFEDVPVTDMDNKLDQLVDGGLVEDAAGIFALDATRLAGLERMGEKSAQNLFSSLMAARRRLHARVSTMHNTIARTGSVRSTG